MDICLKMLCIYSIQLNFLFSISFRFNFGRSTLTVLNKQIPNIFYIQRKLKGFGPHTRQIHTYSRRSIRNLHSSVKFTLTLTVVKTGAPIHYNRRSLIPSYDNTCSYELPKLLELRGRNDLCLEQPP